jgi:hypothetical protein
VTEINDLVLDELEAQEAESDYDRRRLHYGELGSTCFRRDFYNLHLPRDEWDPATPESTFKLQAGKLWEGLVIRALRRSGDEIQTQVSLMPLRPSAWAFAPMHVDAIATNRRHMIEVKARNTAHFAKAQHDPRKLLTDSHVWQGSGYLHEARDRGLVDTASWIFVDRGGDFPMVEVQLTDDILIPLDRIIEREVEKAYLITATEPPPRAPSTLALKVWKGSKKEGRRVEAHEERYSLCAFCKFQVACQPGPEDRLVPLESVSKEVRDAAVAKAEAAWAAGSKVTPQEVKVDEAVQVQTVAVLARDSLPGLPQSEDVRQEIKVDGIVSSDAEGALGLPPSAASKVAAEKSKPRLCGTGPIWEIDERKDVGVGECLVKDCVAKRNAEPCCFCAEHCTTHATQVGTVAVPADSSSVSAAVPAVAPACKGGVTAGFHCSLVEGHDGSHSDTYADRLAARARVSADVEAQVLALGTLSVPSPSAHKHRYNVKTAGSEGPQDRRCACGVHKPSPKGAARCAVCGKSRPTVRLANGRKIHAHCELTPELAAELRDSPGHVHRYEHGAKLQTCRCGAADPNAMTVVSETVTTTTVPFVAPPSPSGDVW